MYVVEGIIVANDQRRLTTVHYCFICIHREMFNLLFEASFLLQHSGQLDSIVVTATDFKHAIRAISPAYTHSEVWKRVCNC